MANILMMKIFREDMHVQGNYQWLIVVEILIVLSSLLL